MTEQDKTLYDARLRAFNEQPTLPDQFAMAALSGQLSNTQIRGNAKDYAKTSYILADAMMEAREVAA